MDLMLTPLHLSREDDRIKKADQLSKERDGDDWFIDLMSFKEFDDRFAFTLDVFASSNNYKVHRFYSEFFEPKALAVEAFAQNWTNEMLWICPPVRHLPNIAKKIRKSNCKGILILPFWPTASFYSHFFIKEREPSYPFKLAKVFRPYIYQNQDAVGPLKGLIQFDMIALYFENFIN